MLLFLVIPMRDGLLKNFLLTHLLRRAMVNGRIVAKKIGGETASRKQLVKFGVDYQIFQVGLVSFVKKPGTVCCKTRLAIKSSIQRYLTRYFD